MNVANDVIARLRALEQPERASFVARYFKTKPGEYGAGDQFLGLSMPQQHAIAKSFRQLPLAETERLVQHPIHECRMVGLLIWVLQTRAARQSVLQRSNIADRYVANRRYVNNWDLVDSSAPALLGEWLLLCSDRSILYELAAEDHLWSQRIAIVATFAFIRKGQFSDTLAISELLLTHPHDLIHKAVGWMLREVGKRNPEALNEFLHDHARQMPRTALRYALEHSDPTTRAHFMAR